MSYQPPIERSEIGDYLKFNKMITPLFIQALFWVGAVLIVLAGLIGIITSLVNGAFLAAFLGLLAMLIGPILWRIYCELIIVMFKINGHLNEIKNTQKEKASL